MKLVTDEIITLVVFVFGYLLYYFSYESPLVYELAQKLGDTDHRKEYSIHIPRLIGFITLGLLPFLFAILLIEQPVTAYGFQFPHGKFAIPISLSLIAISSLVSILRSTKGINTDFYPQVRLIEWSTADHWRNAFFWAIYLLGYEFLLRGPLFFTCLYAYGLLPAIAINSVIYSLIHIYKGKGEAFGAFFLGILLCLAAYQTNSFVIPWVVHVILAVGNDLKALAKGKVH